MKKITILFTLLLLCLTFATSQAVPRSEATLGGITVGMNTSDVTNIYGEPAKISPLKAGNGLSDNAECWLYGDSFEIIFDKGIVVFVSTKANNGIATPSGLTVGSKMFDVRRYYGQTYNDYPRDSYSYNGIEYALYNVDYSALAIEFGYKDGKTCSIKIYAAV